MPYFVLMISQSCFAHLGLEYSDLGFPNELTLLCIALFCNASLKLFTV